MTIEKLLENLLKEKEAIDVAISKIHQYQASTRIRARAKEITDTVKPVKQVTAANKLGMKYNGTHWMQKPENKAKMMKNIRNMQKNRHKK